MAESTPDQLTPREHEVFELARKGYTNNEIASRLGITRNAVRYHLKEVHSKLGTGGERSVLARGWHRGLGWLAFPVAKFGVPATVAAFGSGLVLTGYAAYASLPGEDARAQPPERFSGSVLVDGKYPNGCPGEFSAGTMTLADFAHGQTTLEDLQALNPDLPLGKLEPETLVKVPYDPTGTCSEVTMTPVGSPLRFGTPPAK